VSRAVRRLLHPLKIQPDILLGTDLNNVAGDGGRTRERALHPPLFPPPSRSLASLRENPKLKKGRKKASGMRALRISPPSFLPREALRLLKAILKNSLRDLSKTPSPARSPPPPNPADRRAVIALTVDLTRMREDLYERAYALAHASRRINGIRFRIARIARIRVDVPEDARSRKRTSRDRRREAGSIPALPETFSRDSLANGSENRAVRHAGGE